LRLLIADDHALVRESIAALLKQEANFSVTTVATLEEALAAVEESGGFDLVLLDYKMPGVNGLEGLARMISAAKGAPVALMSGNASRAIAEQAVDSGAAGFLPKTIAARSITSAVRFMAAGEIFVPYGFMQQEDKTVGDLSQRQTEVLRGIAEGKSNKEIARDLNLQEVTIKLHVATLCRKLEARNRTHAIMIAQDMNLL
jgi:DNA-binding NarL/FixJ family response regulator